LPEKTITVLTKVFLVRNESKKEDGPRSVKVAVNVVAGKVECTVYFWQEPPATDPAMSGKYQQILELLYYSIHSSVNIICQLLSNSSKRALLRLLFHRGVYTREEFDLTSKYGQTQFILADSQVRHYIDAYLAQVDGEQPCKWCD
jgi:hypothetical protein